MLRWILGSVRDLWRSYRASRLLRTTQPLAAEMNRPTAASKDSGEPTALDELEAFVRDTYGPDAEVRKLRKVTDADFELVVNVERQDRVVRVRRAARRWIGMRRGE